MKKLKSYGHMDRLSELPDSLILEILSLLTMKDVVRTSLLSKRWKDLWVTIPCLNFIEFRRNFVSNALRLWRGFHVREFSISLFGDQSEDMDLWVQFATERKVEELCIVSKNSLCCPPQCLYECSSLRKLSLYDCNLQIRGNVKWDRLNTLMLDDCVFSEDVMNQVLSSSPQLETFTICIQQIELQSLSIRSCSLKKLSIGYFNLNPSVLTLIIWAPNLQVLKYSGSQYVSYFNHNPSVLTLTIWAPNLQVLTYSGSPYVKCLLTDISSLTEVRLGFSSHRLKVVEKALRQILPVIQHVVTVQLSATCFKVLKDINKGNCSFLPLLNVKLLTIDNWIIKLSNKDFIVGLLECFPSLKMLIINWSSVSEQFMFDAENYTESEVNILKSNMLQLRTVVITTRYVYEASFFEFTGFLLKHASMIEKMVIRKEGVLNSEEMFEAAKNLMSLQRSFPNVDLVFC